MREAAIRIRKHGGGKPIRRSARRLLRLALILPAGICLVLPAQSQLPGTESSPAPMTYPQGTQPGPPPSAESAFQRRRIRVLNAERQKEMVSDANKLLRLTAELNNEVSHNKSDSFTPDQLRQLAKIEKLARSVKNKMSNPVPAAIVDDGFRPPPVALF